MLKNYKAKLEYLIFVCVSSCLSYILDERDKSIPYISEFSIYTVILKENCDIDGMHGVSFFYISKTIN